MLSSATTTVTASTSSALLCESSSLLPAAWGRGEVMAGSSSMPSLPPPCPKSPPDYPDLYGKRRGAAKVQMLEEIGFLEVSCCCLFFIFLFGVFFCNLFVYLRVAFCRLAGERC